jgi:hypothetical protein
MADDSPSIVGSFEELIAIPSKLTSNSSPSGMSSTFFPAQQQLFSKSASAVECLSPVAPRPVQQQQQQQQQQQVYGPATPTANASLNGSSDHHQHHHQTQQQYGSPAPYGAAYESPLVQTQLLQMQNQVSLLSHVCIVAW